MNPITPMLRVVSIAVLLANGALPAQTPALTAPSKGLEIVVQTGHAFPLQWAVYSGDGRYVVTLDSKNQLIVWDAETGAQLHMLEMPRKAWEKIWLHPTRNEVLAYGYAQSEREERTGLTRWDIESGKLIPSLDLRQKIVAEGHYTIDQILATQDGETVFIRCRGRKGEEKYGELAWLRRTSNGEVVNDLSPEGKGRLLAPLALSPDGRQLVTGGTYLESHGLYKSIRLFDLVSNRLLINHPCTYAKFSDNGKYLLTDHGLRSGPNETGPQPKEAVIWDTATGKKLLAVTGRATPLPKQNFVMLSPDIHIAQDSALAAVNHYDGVELWDLARAHRLRELPIDGSVIFGCVFSRDGKSIATLAADRTVTIWDVSTGKQRHKLAGHTGRVSQAHFSPDGKHLVTSSVDRTAIIWDAETGQRKKTLVGHICAVSNIILTADEKRLAQISFDGRMHLWDLDHGERITRIEAPEGAFGALAADFEGKRLYTTRHRHIDVWDPKTGARIGGWETPNLTTYGASLDRAGKRLVVAHNDMTFTIWDTQRGELIQKVPLYDKAWAPQQSVRIPIWNGGAISDDGTRVLLPSWDRFFVKDVITGRELAASPEGGTGTDQLVFGRDGRKGYGFFYNCIREFDTESGQFLRNIGPEGTQSGRMSVSRDGRTLLLGNTAWDIASGRQAWALPPGTNATSMQVTAHGRRVLAGTADGNIRVFDIATGRELARLMTLDEGKDWLVVTPDGLFDGSLMTAKYITFRIPGTNDFVPLERYQQKYWRPGLLAAIMRGEKPEPTVNINKTLPPKVRFAEALKFGMELKFNKFTIEAIAETRSEFPVKAFRLIVDGRPYRGQLGVQKLAEPKVGESRAKWDVELEPGKHTLKVMVDTEYVQGASDEIEVKYVGGSAGPVDLPALFILAIGISDYPDATRKLDFAHLDAQAVADAFRAHSKTLFKEIDAKVVTNKDANRRGIFAGMQWLREKMAARPNSIGILFFAGHGEKDPADGMLYLLPHDFEEKNYGASAIEATTFKNQLASIPGRLMLILDACHSGETGKEKTRSSGELTDQLIRDLTAEEHGLIVFASALGHQKAQESREFKHGMFTQAMIEALSGKAPKSADGAVYLDSMIGYVGNRVRDMTKGYQSPVPGRPIAIRDFPVSKP